MSNQGSLRVETTLVAMDVEYFLVECSRFYCEIRSHRKSSLCCNWQGQGTARGVRQTTAVSRHCGFSSVANLRSRNIIWIVYSNVIGSHHVFRAAVIFCPRTCKPEVDIDTHTCVMQAWLGTSHGVFTAVTRRRHRSHKCGDRIVSLPSDSHPNHHRFYKKGAVSYSRSFVRHA